MTFPEHKGSLSLSHNEYKDCYSTVSQWFVDNFENEEVDPKILAECIKTDSVWCLRWYPDTPVGFIERYGPTLESVLESASCL